MVEKDARMQVQVQVQVEESRDSHFDACAGVAVPPAPHTHLQVGCAGKPKKMNEYIIELNTANFNILNKFFN